MSDRVEPIRATEGTVPPVARVTRRERRRDDEPPRERRRTPEPSPPVVERDEDGIPHVDVRA